jgi:hypothetical protein
MPKHEPRIDSYIAEAAPFARPVLKHFRALVHKANPDIEESIKWRMPFFVLGGTNVCHMAAFKAHAAIGFWGKEMRREIAQKYRPAEESMGEFGRITKLSDLPPDRVLIKYVKQACEMASARR